jgi:hypothetical protein
MTEAVKSWFSRRVEGQLKELASGKRSGSRVAIAVVAGFSLIMLYFVAHQMWLTGFFITTFGTLEMFLFYGSWFEWIIVAALERVGRKHLSRDIDAFGGLVFVTISAVWLVVVFPFEFAYFADVLPDGLRFLLRWLSNDIARMALILWIIVNLISAVYYGVLRVLVRRALYTGNSVLQD